MIPNIINFLGDSNSPNGALQYAVVMNGVLQATNNKMACYLKVENFVNTEEAKNMEGKVFSKTDLSNLYHLGDYCFLPDHFKVKGIEYPYSGIIDSERVIHPYDDLMGDYEIEKSFKKFPDITQLLDIFTNSQVDPAKVQKRNTHFRGVGLPVSALHSSMQAFGLSIMDTDFLRLEFFHAAKDKEKVDKVSAPILVTPLKGKNPLYSEIVIINPVI